MQTVAAHRAWMEKRVLWHFACGAGLALAGVAIVEGLLLVGLHPLGPVGWPGLGVLAATAFGGIAGLIGGSLVVYAYYVLNFFHQYRFPEFYANPYGTVSWAVALGLLAIGILAARPRVLREISAEVELAARRLYEGALVESEERLRVITDNLPALVAYIDAGQHYRFNNRAYEDWLHMPRKEIVGRPVREVWGEERYALFKPNLERALRGERVTHEYAVNEGGVERHILASYVPDLDASGHVRGFFLLGSDITQ